MKKISLKNLNLKEAGQLARGQLKNVIGGFSGGGAKYMCFSEGIACGFSCSGWVEVKEGHPRIEVLA